MNSNAIEKAVAQWPDDISSLLHDDPQYRCEVWSRLAFSFRSDGFPEAAYLLPAIEKAISTRSLDGIEDYTPPPHPGTPPEVKPLPNHVGTLTWLRGQFDHYLHDLQSAITKRKESIESLEVFGDGIVQTKDERDKVVALIIELERRLPEFPDCLSSYVEFVERRQVDGECRNAIGTLLGYEVFGNEMKLRAVPTQFGTATQALERVLAFYERERNRIVARLAEVEQGQSELSRKETPSVASSGNPTPAGQTAAVNETGANPGGGSGTTTTADDSGRKAEEGLAVKVEKLRSAGARPVWIEAYVSYYLALASGRLRSKHTQKEAYELIKEEEMYQELGAKSEKERFGLRFGEIPEMENWSTYDRKARQLLGELKNSPRAGREYRVEADDVDTDTPERDQETKLKPDELRYIYEQNKSDDLRCLLADALIAEGEAEEGIWDDIVQSLEKLDLTEPDVQQICDLRDVARLGEVINVRFPPTA